MTKSSLSFNYFLNLISLCAVYARVGCEDFSHKPPSHELVPKSWANNLHDRELFMFMRRFSLNPKPLRIFYEFEASVRPIIFLL